MFDQAVHDTIKRKNKIFALSIVVLTIVFVVLRMILTRFFILYDIHFYDTDNMLVLSVDYIIAASIVIIYIISFFMYKRKREGKYCAETSDCFVQGTQALVFSASLTGFLFVLCSAFQVYYFIAMGNSFGELKEMLFDVAIFFAAILSSVYFFKTAAMNFDIGENIEQYEKIEQQMNINNANGGEDKPAPKSSGKQKFTSTHILFSFMPVIWAFLNVFKYFFDMSRSVNSPVRIYELMSFLALSVFFVSESRMLVERRESSRFFTFSYIAVILVAISSLPNLIWSSFWILEPNDIQAVYAVELSLAVYVLTRIYSQIRYGRFMLQK